MAKHAASQTVAVVPTGSAIIRPVVLSAEAFLQRVRATPPAAGRHSRG
jgi:hypothetical protein